MIPKLSQKNLLFSKSRFSGWLRGQLNAIYAGDLFPLQPRAQRPIPDMTIYIEPSSPFGYQNPAWISGTGVINFAGGSTETITAPVSHPRIDNISIDNTGTLEVTTGDEASVPIAPKTPVGNLGICLIYLPVGCTQIVDAESIYYYEGEAYIYRDIRPRIRLGGSSSIQSIRYLSILNTFGGDGSGGNLVVSASANITNDTIYQYDNVTINSGQTLGLSAQGNMILLVAGDLDVEGTISVSGKGGTGGAAGTNNGQQAWISGGDGNQGKGNIRTYPPYFNYAEMATMLVNSNMFPLAASMALNFFGGGGGSATSYAGGAGGGVCLIEVMGNVTIGASGIITASGANGTASYSGGGGGGTVLLVYHGELVNAGSIIANGGSGVNAGDAGFVKIYQV
jgi:hypothetical protein